MEKAFKSMLSFSKYRRYREDVFCENQNCIAAITLKKDTVIPTRGVEGAFGKKYAGKVVEEWDFLYEYSHQVPFPVHSRVAPEMVEQSFSRVFERAADFLG
jgi:hypothetical protein